MGYNSYYIDLIAAISAGAAAIASIYSAYRLQKDNARKDMLDNYTKERLENVHDIKKWSSVILRESRLITIGVSTNDEKGHIYTILEAFNELWYLFKPIYEIDKKTQETLVELTDLLIEFYTKGNEWQGNEDPLKNKILEASANFRLQTFLYAQSGWTCVKNQILHGEQSSYCEFSKIYEETSKIIENHTDDIKHSWAPEKRETFKKGE